MFVALTILFVIGNASLVFLVFMSIQKDQLLDVAFDWQKKLRNWDVNGTSKKHIVLHKILGGCELCFSHLISFMGFWCYLIFITSNVGNMYFDYWWVWIIWYFIYVPLTTNLGLYFITKLYAKNKD